MALKPVWEHLAHGNTTALGKNQIISVAQMPMPLRRNGCVNYATRKYFFFERGKTMSDMFLKNICALIYYMNLFAYVSSFKSEMNKMGNCL